MTQPGVLQSAWRYRLLVAAIIALFAVGAAVLSLSRPASFVAGAVVVLEDPSLSDLLTANSNDASRRFVGNALEIFRSLLVTSKAAEIAAAEGFEVTDADVATNASVRTLGGTDVITVTYSDSDPQRAVVVADSIITAYDQVQIEQLRTENTRIQERLGLTEELLQANLEPVEAQINSILARRGTEGHIEEILDRMSSVQERLLEVTDQAVRAPLLDELAELRIQLEILRITSSVETDSSELAALLEEQDKLQGQLTAIDERRTELQLEAAIEGSGIAFFSPASVAEVASGAGHFFSIAGGILLGGMVAIGVAYTINNKRRRFLEASEPELILNTPLLAEVPRWSNGEDAWLPVRDDPRSLTAEAFRFSNASVDIRLAGEGYKSVNFVSASVGAGKSTLVANTALAAARSGKRVLLIDCDFGSQASSRLLVKDWTRPGLTDLVLGQEHLESAVSTTAIPSGGGTLHVMGRGTLTVTAPDFFANPLLNEFFSSVEALYDMVLVDGPPLLEVAYASSIARLVDALVLVVPHESKIGDAEDLSQRAQFVGTPVLGYIYNLASRRAGRQPVTGSLADVLGDRGAATRT